MHVLDLPHWPLVGATLQLPVMGDALPQSTTVQPSESQQGVPDESDRIVRELDVYVVNGELGSGAQVRDGGRLARRRRRCRRRRLLPAS